MAGAIALNTYKTFRIGVTTGISTVYTVPNGVSAIHLFSSVSNITTGVATVTVYHNRNNDRYELIKNAKIPTTDVLNPISGSLVLEVGDKIEIQGTSENSAKYVISILESAK